MTNLIFKDFPGPGNYRNINQGLSRIFQEAWGSCWLCPFSLATFKFSNFSSISRLVVLWWNIAVGSLTHRWEGFSLSLNSIGRVCIPWQLSSFNSKCRTSCKMWQFIFLHIMIFYFTCPVFSPCSFLAVFLSIFYCTSRRLAISMCIN